MQRKCAACGGHGYVSVGAGLNALKERYPDLPIREIVDRGWLGDLGDGEDVARCDAAFLAFWDVDTHDELAEALASPESLISRSNRRRALATQPRQQSHYPPFRLG